MFAFQDSRGERIGRVVMLHCNFMLQNYRAMIEQLIDKMYSASGDLDAGVERLFLSIEAWEGGQQARMNIYDPLWKSAYKLRRQQPHIAGKTDQLNASLFQLRDDLGIVFFAFSAFSFDHNGLDTAFTRLYKTSRVSFVANNDRDLARRYLAALDGVDDGDHIRPAA